MPKEKTHMYVNKETLKRLKAIAESEGRTIIGMLDVLIKEHKPKK